MADVFVRSESPARQLSRRMVSPHGRCRLRLPCMVAGLALLVLEAAMAPASAQSCDGHADCPSGQVCSLEATCMDPIVASGPATVDTGGPVIPGVPFGLTLAVPFFRNELKPKTVVVRCETCALEIPAGAPAVGSVEQEIDGMPFAATFPILIMSENLFFGDVNDSGVFDAGDVVIRAAPAPLILTITVPDQEEALQAFDGAVRLAIDPIFVVADESIPSVQVAIVSLDPDTHGGTDAQGIAPKIVLKSFPVEVRPGIDELCPCAGPAPDVAWKNHGRYVVCVARAAKELVKERAERMPVSRNSRGRWRAFKEWWEYVAEAARSDCGRKRRGRW